MAGQWQTGCRQAGNGREWNGAQSGQGAIELGFPGPALGKMEGEAACRAGEPSGEGEEPLPEDLGGHHLLAQTDARCPASEVVRQHLHRQPSGVLPKRVAYGDQIGRYYGNCRFEGCPVPFGPGIVRVAKRD